MRDKSYSATSPYHSRTTTETSNPGLRQYITGGSTWGLLLGREHTWIQERLGPLLGTKGWAHCWAWTKAELVAGRGPRRGSLQGVEMHTQDEGTGRGLASAAPVAGGGIGDRELQLVKSQVRFLNPKPQDVLTIFTLAFQLNDFECCARLVERHGGDWFNKDGGIPRVNRFKNGCAAQTPFDLSRIDYDDYLAMPPAMAWALLGASRMAPKFVEDDPEGVGIEGYEMMAREFLEIMSRPGAPRTA